MTTGNVFFVDSGAAAGADSTDRGTSPDKPFLTIDYAIGRCTASNGDVIFVMPGHADTPAASITCDIAGVAIIGLGVGRNRPTITPAHTAADNTIDVTADDVLIKNIIIAAGTNSTGNTVQVKVSADDFTMEDCIIEQGAKNLYGVEIDSNKDRATFTRCLFKGTAANPDYGIDIGVGSGDCEDITVQNCTFNYAGSGGLDAAGIKCDKICTGILIKDCTMIGMDLAAVDFNSSATGLCVNLAVQSNNSTVAELIDAGHIGFVDTKVTYKAVTGIALPSTTATE